MTDLTETKAALAVITKNKLDKLLTELKKPHAAVTVSKIDQAVHLVHTIEVLEK